MAKSLRNGGFSRFEQNYRLEGGLLVDFTHIVPSVRFGSLADVRKKRATESLRGLARLARERRGAGSGNPMGGGASGRGAILAPRAPQTCLHVRGRFGRLWASCCCRSSANSASNLSTAALPRAIAPSDFAKKTPQRQPIGTARRHAVMASFRCGVLSPVAVHKMGK